MYIFLLNLARSSSLPLLPAKKPILGFEGVIGPVLNQMLPFTDYIKLRVFFNDVLTVLSTLSKFIFAKHSLGNLVRLENNALQTFRMKTKINVTLWVCGEGS